MTTDASLSALSRSAVNDRACSAVVRSQRWEICDGDRYRGHCRVLRPGQYPSLLAMAQDDRIASVRAIPRQSRRVDERRYAPQPAVTGDYRRRDRKSLYEVPVDGARAVYAGPTPRCWIAREEVTNERRSDARVPGAVLGAVIGGNIGRNRQGETIVTRAVERCASNPSWQSPAYWGVSYVFRGQQPHVQLLAPPGTTTLVNGSSEPRV